MTDHAPAIVTRLECGDTVIERCSNWHTSALTLAHFLMHGGETAKKQWKVTIEPRQMTSEEYDTMRAKFEAESMGELLALDLTQHLEPVKGGD